MAHPICGTRWAVIAPRLWALVPKDVPYEWSGLGKTARERLAEVAPSVSLPTSLSGLDLNIQLRNQLSPALHNASVPELARIADWIIKSWGGIPGGAKDACLQWSMALIGFDDARVSAFTAAQGTDRISSWSKVLAFARPDRDAIYDARTAVALNIMLSALGEDQRFHMPVGRNGDVARAAAMLQSASSSLGYEDYIALLGSIAAATGRTLLEVETTIFAVAPPLSKRFVEHLAKHGQSAARQACQA